MREDEAEEQEIEGEEWEEEVVTPSTNGFRSDDEDMICFARCVCSCVCVFVCELACTSGGHGFVMSLTVEPKYDDLGVLSVSV